MPFTKGHTGYRTKKSFKEYALKKENHWNWKGGFPECIDCNKQLKSYYSTRCSPCYGKTKVKDKPIFNCLFCKKEFIDLKSDFDRKYCNRKCHNGYRKNQIPWNKGKVQYQTLGDKNPNWQGGKTEESKRLRNTVQYKNWRKSVFERDNYTCQNCEDKRGGNLEADHELPFALFPDLRFEVLNGRTLCVPCHQATETYGNITRSKKIHLII